MAEQPRDKPGNPVDAPSDRSLLRRLQAGSDDAATQIYRRYAKRLRGLARANTTGSLARRVDTEDIVQSVFRVFFAGAKKGLYHVPDGEDLWKLLLIIALNKIRAEGVYHHAAKRDVRHTTQLDADDAPPVQEGDDEFATNFLQLVVRDTLELLPDFERRLIDLRLSGYEMEEISQMVGRSKRTVERSLQQARDRLKEIFEKD
jgi:RNA polymerase sigma-70 factor (ECF subfamily)